MSPRASIDETLEKLGRPGLSDETIVLLTHLLAQLHFPDLQVELVAKEELKFTTLDGATHRMYLTNMLVECRREPEDRAAIVDRYVRVIAGRDSEGEMNSLENLVTLVRDAQFLGVVQQESPIAARHLIADLWLVLARDGAESVTTLSKKDAEALSEDFEALFKRGEENVLELLEGLTARPYSASCYTFETENVFYLSSVVAMDFLWDQVGALVEGDVVLGVPARDTLLFCGANDRAGIAELRAEVDYVIKNGHHLVSDTLLRRVNGQWQVFS
ncbi:hypothetical protein SAMN05421819_0417 [Bryocella elongata]|uniref:DUF1444 family protein n=1 Tax=Bryocella elongata TaxID=863522 RepID=A0A1H5SZN2_9BACT|nr:hypothetical protein [Bryocella elongata]SEF55975.1 hypothetical protein SAMN05421819_0417 [Bryocella elongata]